jgi:arginine transport system substrate-binding protein
MKISILGLTTVLYLSVINLFAYSKGVQPFVIGTTSGYAPFVSLNDKGEYEGFDIDIAKELASKLNRPLKLKDYGNMPSLMLALKQKKVDALIWAISITEDRKNTFKMIHYQGDKMNEVPLIFWGEIPEKIKTLADLGNDCKKPICVEAGSYQEEIMKTFPKISLKYFDGVQDVILDLKYGKSIASSVDPALLPRFLNKYPKLKVLSFPLPKELQSEGNGICLNKENQELAEKVSKAIDELKKEGVIFQLERKWELRNDN